MAHLIDKDALVAEIDNRINELRGTVAELGNLESHNCGIFHDICLYKDIHDFVDTLEVKEVDLEHEVESCWKQCDMTWCRDAYSMTHIRSMLSDIAKHFFELGLKVQKGE